MCFVTLILVSVVMFAEVDIHFLILELLPG